MKEIHIIGGGLAGSEAAYQLAKRDHKVIMHEMRPTKYTEAHITGELAELVCSNSLKSESLTNSKGLIKEEMRQFDSLILKVAEATRLKAGQALAVDRNAFSKEISTTLENHPNITIKREEVKEMPKGPVIIATGPLTSSALKTSIEKYFDETILYFYDAMAPIISEESIDMSVCYKKNRWEDDEVGDYINCPMNEEEYDYFFSMLEEGDTAVLRDFESHLFEGCMPIEGMAKRGKDTLRFGPLKPVGLRRDKAHRPHAVIQLRKDNAAETLYNMVGFQTRLKFPEQKKLVRSIPGLQNAEIVRYGQMHRNTYMPSPKYLNPAFQTYKDPEVFFAGQITGVEGYVESSASGMIAAINMDRVLKGKTVAFFPNVTMLGALSRYISGASKDHFQPMNANFGILPSPEDKMKKDIKRQFYRDRALKAIQSFKEMLYEQ